MKLGKSFIDTFSNNLNKDKDKEKKQESAVPEPVVLSNKMGINTAKKTQLQQGILQNISSSNNNNNAI